MSICTHQMEGDNLILYFSGRMDSSNAPAVQAEIDAILDKCPGKNVIADLDAMEYISSAGLRVFLHVRKKLPALKIINVSLSVYDIFEVTGFTEILDVSKAYRRVSVEDCEIIGKGANGIIYRLDPEIIIKAYRNPDALDDIKREREMARKAFILGIPTAISFDIVRVGNGYGAAYELLDAYSIAQILQKNPEETDTCVKLSTDLLKTIHATEVAPGELPNIQKSVLEWVNLLADYLPGDVCMRLDALIRAIPNDNHILHGDYHIKNVMIRDGEAFLIDMDTLAQGHPIFELAFMYNAYIGFSELSREESRGFLNVPEEVAVTFWEKQLRAYLGTDDPEAVRRVEDKARLIGYIRLLRYVIRRIGIDTEEGKVQSEYVKDRIQEMIGRVDSLSF